MEKKINLKEFKTPSELNKKNNLSKYSKTNNTSRPFISKRKNKSE
jgi:hypothetical protein